MPIPYTTSENNDPFWGGSHCLKSLVIPKGPKIEKFQDRPPGLKFSSEIENFKQAAHQTPIFGVEFRRLKISSEIEHFQSLGR